MIDAKRLRGSCPAHPRYQAGCTDCQAHSAARRRQRHRLVAYGQWEPPGSTKEARAHLGQLIAAGMGQRAIAEASGVARAVINRIVNGDQDQARAATITAILGTQPQIAPGSWVSSLGASRRLQALMSLGWDAAALAARLDVSASQVGAWRQRQALRIRHRYHQAIAGLYRQLADHTGPNEMARRQAKYLGYARPINWDDDGDLDNPAAKPKGMTLDQHRRTA